MEICIWSFQDERERQRRERRDKKEGRDRKDGDREKDDRDKRSKEEVDNVLNFSLFYFILPNHLPLFGHLAHKSIYGILWKHPIEFNATSMSIVTFIGIAGMVFLFYDHDD